MEANSLFPLKYHLRKTDELVEVIASETIEKGARNENDWVSYIDSQGVEHIKEHLTLEWDFTAENPFEKGFLAGLNSELSKLDIWESRRYELAKQFFVDEKIPVSRVEPCIWAADEFIAALKPKEDEDEPNKGL